MWLLLLLVNLLWLGTSALWQPPSAPTVAVAWGAFGGLAALTSPIVAGALAVLTAWRWWPSALRQGGTQLLLSARPLAIAAFTSILVIMPWTIRNRLVLGKWIPIKSNVMYEVWQSQCLDDDGVLDSKTIRHHPFPANGEQRRRYVEVGEMSFDLDLSCK